jgi:hypothetical protein
MQLLPNPTPPGFHQKNKTHRSTSAFMAGHKKNLPGGGFEMNYLMLSEKGV